MLSCKTSHILIINKWLIYSNNFEYFNVKCQCSYSIIYLYTYLLQQKNKMFINKQF